MDRFVTVTQGEVFFATELLARAEGLERGPAGNTSLAAALAIGREMAEEEILVVSETGYTGAGKSPVPQLEFAVKMGVEVATGDPRGDHPGRRIVIPLVLEMVAVGEVSLDRLRNSYLQRVSETAGRELVESELTFVAEDTGSSLKDIEVLTEGVE